MSVLNLDAATVQVEIGFSTTSGSNKVPWNGNSTDIVWTDVTQWVRSVNIRRGRSTELDRYMAGSVSIVLDNRDRRFDPDYSSSPYNGALTPLRPVRVSSKPPGSATTYRLFTGFADGWPQKYVNPSDGFVTLTATDAFKPLNLSVLPSYWEGLVRKSSPYAWFRMDDGNLSPVARDTVGVIADGLWTNASGSTTETQTTGLIAANTNSASLFDGSKWVQFANGLAINTGDRSLECWIQTSTSTNGSYQIARFGGAEYICGLGMVVSGGVGTIKAWTGATFDIGNIYIASNSITVNDGRPHHIVVRGGGTTQDVWVDGTSAIPFTGAAETTGFSGVNTIGKADTVYYPVGHSFASNFNGTIDEVVLYNTALSSTDIIAHYSGGAAGSGETAGARVGRILDLIGWPSDGRQVSASGDALQAVNIIGKSALGYLQDVETSDRGLLFIQGDGKIRYHSRVSLFGETTYTSSQGTFGDGVGENHYVEFQSSYTDQLIKNYVTAQRVDGYEAAAISSTSIASYWQRNDSTSNMLNSDDQDVIDYVNSRLAVYKDPLPRVDSVTLNPRGNVNLYSYVMSLDLASRITIKRRPQDVGSAISRDMIIEGISHTITPDTWTTTWELSPASVTDFFVLDNATLGTLDNNRLGY